MRQFSFETNIESRMPDTGKVYFVDRMTNEYAERWPLNVSAFILAVCEKWQESNVAEVQKYFNYGLGRKGEKHSTHCPAKMPDKVTKQGEIIIGEFPEQSSAKVYALIEAWNKGAEYHTKGFRQGDVLPEKLPACKITRLPDGGWIALFPKEMHLLESRPETTEATEMALAFDEPQAEEESNLPKIDGGDDAANDFDEPNLDLNLTTMNDVTTVETAEVSAVETSGTEGTGTSVPSADAETAHVEPVPAVPRSQREILAERRHQRRLERERMQRSYEERMEREAREAEEYARQQERRKIFAAVGAAAVTLVMIYFFGLLGPAVFGLLCGGLLKG